MLVFDGATCGGQRILRKGRKLAEFLLLAGKRGGETHLFVWEYFASHRRQEGVQFFKCNVVFFLIVMEHDGIFVYLVVSDREVFSSLDRFVQQRLEGHTRRVWGQPWEKSDSICNSWTGCSELLVVVTTNNLKWALAPYGKEQKNVSCKRDMLTLSRAAPLPLQNHLRKKISRENLIIPIYFYCY